MAVKTTDFTKSRQRLESPPPAEKRMNADRHPHRLLWVLGVLLLVGMIIGARFLINGSGSSGDVRDNEAPPPGVLAQALIDNAKRVTSIHAVGEVMWVIEEGTVVKEGDLLLKVNNEREMAQFKQAEADYEAAKALVEKAKNGEKSYKLLVDQQKSNAEAAKLAMHIAEEKYERAQETAKLISKQE